MRPFTHFVSFWSLFPFPQNVCHCDKMCIAFKYLHFAFPLWWGFSMSQVVLFNTHTCPLQVCESKIEINLFTISISEVAPVNVNTHAHFTNSVTKYVRRCLITFFMFCFMLGNRNPASRATQSTVQILQCIQLEESLKYFDF